jgi:hypothetical protein
MGALEVYYLPEHADHPLTITTPDQVQALISTMSATSPPDAPLLAEIHLAGDPYTQGFEVGVRSDHGVIRYTGRQWRHGITSTTEAPDPGTGADNRPCAYFYMGHWREFPAEAEIPLPQIAQAVNEFLDTSGERPTNIRWQTEP